MRLSIAAAALSLLIAAPAVQAAPLAPVADGPALSKAASVEVATTTHKKKKVAKRKPASSTQHHSRRTATHRA